MALPLPSSKQTQRATCLNNGKLGTRHLGSTQQDLPDLAAAHLEEDVGWVEVAVADAVGVHVPHAACDVREDGDE